MRYVDWYYIFVVEGLFDVYRNGLNIGEVVFDDCLVGVVDGVYYWLVWEYEVCLGVVFEGMVWFFWN